MVSVLANNSPLRASAVQWWRPTAAGIRMKDEAVPTE
jgi:hypothetical protein